MKNCLDNLVKYFLVLVNCVFFLIGIILISFGGYTQYAAKDFLEFLGNNYVQHYNNLSISVIVLGVIICLISLFGCCGATKENKWLLYIYGCLIIVILIAQIGAGVAAFAVKGNMGAAIKKKMFSQMAHYEEAGYEAVTKAWDAVQERLECCGVNTWTDWQLNSTSVPDSCCLGDRAGCGLEASQDALHSRGCFSAFKQKFVDNLDNVGIMVLCVAVMELIIILLACCLGNRMKKSRKNPDKEAPPPPPTTINAGTVEEIEKLTSRIVSLSKEKADIEISEAKAQAEIQSLKSEITKITEEAKKKTEVSMTSTNGEIVSLKTELEGAAGEIKKLTEQLESMKGLKRELENSKENAEKERKSKAEIEVMIGKERSALGNLNKQLEDMKKANKSGEDEVKSLKKELDMMKGLQKELESARNDAEKEKKSKTEIEAMISRERNVVVDLTKQLEELKEANRNAEDEMRSLKEELETMQDQESENGRDDIDSSSSKEELESPEMPEAGGKKKWIKKAKKSKKNVF